jgi:hypothetical protein
LPKLAAIRRGGSQIRYSAPRQPLQKLFECDPTFEFGEIRSEAMVRAHCKSQMLSQGRSIDVKAIWLDKHIRVTVCRSQEAVNPSSRIRPRF